LLLQTLASNVAIPADTKSILPITDNAAGYPMPALLGFDVIKSKTTNGRTKRPSY